MTADEWLTARGDDVGPRRPWDGDNGRWWYWFSPDTDDPGETIHALPGPVWNRMLSRTTYPSVKMYKTPDEALADFRQAFDRAVADGWVPT
jgi:hypothetical protein